MLIFILIFLALSLNSIWVLSFRNTRIIEKYRKGTNNTYAFNFQADANSIKSAICNQLVYQDMIGRPYEQNGDIIISTNSGAYNVQVANSYIAVYCSLGYNDLLKEETAEEAMCICSHIVKLIDSTAPVLPTKEYNDMDKAFKMKKLFRKNLAIIMPVIAIFFISSAVLVFNSFDDGSSGISSSYLSTYSTEVTIGKLFDSVFYKGSWETYSIGKTKYVDYLATNKDKDEMVMTFELSNDDFKVINIKVNGDNIDNSLGIAIILASIYAEYDD